MGIHVNKIYKQKFAGRAVKSWFSLFV